MFDSGPDLEELKRLGIPVEAVAKPAPVIIFPDNEQAYQLFCDISDQWRSHMSGYYALDANVVYSWMDGERIKGQRRNQLWREVRQISSGALAAMREQQEEAQRKASANK